MAHSIKVELKRYPPLKTAIETWDYLKKAALAYTVPFFINRHKMTWTGKRLNEYTLCCFMENHHFILMVNCILNAQHYNSRVSDFNNRTNFDCYINKKGLSLS